jgi:hypothetical protein
VTDPVTLVLAVIAGALIGLSLGTLVDPKPLASRPYEGEQIMCRPVTCKTCAKTTWAGCGQHVAQVKSMVPANQWCPGHPEAGRRAGSWLDKLLGR